MAIWKDPEKFLAKAREYFETAKYPNIHGLSIYLGYRGRTSFYRCKERGGEWPEVFEAIQELLTDRVAQLLGDKSVPVAGTIFHLKQLGWVDKQEVKHEGDLVINLVQYGKDNGTNNPV